jgi:hypothetical protein
MRILPFLFAEPVLDFVIRDALAELAADHDADRAGLGIDLDALATSGPSGSNCASNFDGPKAIARARSELPRLRHAQTFCAARSYFVNEAIISAPKKVNLRAAVRSAFCCVKRFLLRKAVFTAVKRF